MAAGGEQVAAGQQGGDRGVKRILRLYLTLWQQVERIAVAAVWRGRDVLRGRLTGKGDKLDAESVGRQAAESLLGDGAATMSHPAFAWITLRLRGLKNAPPGTLQSHGSHVVARLQARLRSAMDKLAALAVLCGSVSRAILSPGGQRLRGGLERHAFVPAARVRAVADSMAAIMFAATDFWGRVIVGSAAVVKTIATSLASALARAADASASLSGARSYQTSRIRGRAIVGSAAPVKSRPSTLSGALVTLISYITAKLISRASTMSYLRGRAVVGNVAPASGYLRQIAAAGAALAADGAATARGLAKTAFRASSRAMAGAAALLMGAIRTGGELLARLHAAPISQARCRATFSSPVGMSRAATGLALRAAAKAWLTQQLSNVLAPADRPADIDTRSKLQLIPTIKGLGLGLTQSFSGRTILANRASLVQGLKCTAASDLTGIGTGAVLRILARMRAAQGATGYAAVRSMATSCCTLSVLSPADWIYPDKRGSRLYFYQVVDAAQNGETLNLT